MKALFLTLILAATCSVVHAIMPLSTALGVLRNIKAEGAGNEAGEAAWRHVATRPCSELPEVLKAMDGCHPVARNYLYSAAKAMTTQAGAVVPVASMETFLADVSHDAVARKLCYEIIVEQDAAAAERLLPKLVKDPAAGLRRLAVQRLIAKAGEQQKGGKPAAAIALYEEALTGAIEEEQVKSIADELKALGKPVDLLQHFGFLTQWKIVGPFTNKDRNGFAESFQPEKGKLDFTAKYAGKDEQIGWKDYTVTDPMGLILFNKEMGEVKEVLSYAASDFISPTARPAQIRLGCKNAWKVWLNGELVFERDEYHRGTRIDQYILPVELAAGANRILVKCCQNEEMQAWTKEWQFQLRVTDLNGDALRSSN